MEVLAGSIYERITALKRIRTKRVRFKKEKGMDSHGASPISKTF
jgi:hypothetical protein